MTTDYREPIRIGPTGTSGAYAGAFRRISWGSIFAGVVVALVFELTLGILGLGIGFGVVNPATEQNPLGGIGIAAGIWFGLSTLIALFAGGWVAGRLAGFPRSWNGVIHGLVMWGMVTLLSFYLMTTAVGLLISGVAGVIGKGLTMIASGIEIFGPQAAQMAGQELQQRGITLDQITGQAQQMISQTGVAQDPELQQSLRRLFADPQQAGSQQDREAVISALTRSGMSREQASTTVDNWIRQYYQAAATAQNVQQEALERSEAAMNALATAAIWAFVALVLGALAASAGGMLGSPKEIPPAREAEGPTL